MVSTIFVKLPKCSGVGEFARHRCSTEPRAGAGQLLPGVRCTARGKDIRLAPDIPLIRIRFGNTDPKQALYWITPARSTLYSLYVKTDVSVSVT